MTLYYIHGYQSSPESTKGRILSDKLGVIPLAYRKGKPEDLAIPDALQSISNSIKNDAEVTLIGSSLGGFLAVKTAQQHENVKQIILLNPALLPPETDITKITDMPSSIVEPMYDESLFHQLLPCDIQLFIGTEDTVVPNKWGITFAQQQEATIHFLKDDHRFSRYTAQLPSLIQPLLK